MQSKLLNLANSVTYQITMGEAETLKAQLHGSGSSSNLNYITKACRKPLCAQCVYALYAYTLELIVEVTFQITHTQKHS